MQSDAKTVDEYVTDLPEKRQQPIAILRALILDTMPEAEESMDYGMATYIRGEHPLAALASQKNYMSLYVDVDVLTKHRSELGKLDCGKSCIRFRKLDDLPMDVVRTILQETYEQNLRL
ncbi:MAG: DUF1801 domain-containing protein [Chloroflexi bacterium]|nr:DUF1801 domain-containing protein [Chloroflexota bacterium]